MTSYTPPHNKILWFVIFSFLLICSMIQSSLSCHWEPNVIRCKIICLSYYNQFTISFQECIQTNKINIGAILCAVICILIHPFSTSFWRIIEMIVTFIFIYGMVNCANKTQNAWGCIFAFFYSSSGKPDRLLSYNKISRAIPLLTDEGGI